MSMSLGVSILSPLKLPHLRRSLGGSATWRLRTGSLRIIKTSYVIRFSVAAAPKLISRPFDEKMKLERSNVEFAIWRKKVDKSLFEHNGTTIPEWACRMWSLPEIYEAVTSRKDPRSNATVVYKGMQYDAWVTTAPHGRKSPAFRLWFDPVLALGLKGTFLMSYMRSLEGTLQGNVDIEQVMPFWEFLDIEFDKQRRVFRFVAYYRQEASFPHLFDRLIGS